MALQEEKNFLSNSGLVLHKHTDWTVTDTKGKDNLCTWEVVHKKQMKQVYLNDIKDNHFWLLSALRQTYQNHNFHLSL